MCSVSEQHLSAWEDSGKSFCLLSKAWILEVVPDKQINAPEILRAWYQNFCLNAFFKVWWYEIKKIFLDTTRNDERNYSVCWERGHRKYFQLVGFKVANLGGILFIRFISCLFFFLKYLHKLVSLIYSFRHSGCTGKSSRHRASLLMGII